MSSLVGRRSANRGLCAQPCRLPYRLVDATTGRYLPTCGDRLLSPLDLCAIDLLDRLRASGVAALKIEGRMKSADYVAAVTRAYREALDEIATSALTTDAGGCGPMGGGECEQMGGGGKTTPVGDGAEHGPMEGAARRGPMEGADETTLVGNPIPTNGAAAHLISTSREALARSYSRGFTSAYLSGERGNAMMGYTRSAGRNGTEGTEAPLYTTDALFQANNGLVILHATVAARVGQPLAISFTAERDGDTAAAHGPVVEPARARALTRTDIIEHVGRVGNTPFSIASWDIQLDAGAGLSFSALHATRRAALDSLEEHLLKPWHSRRLRRSSLRGREQLPPARRGTPFVAVLVRDAAGAKAARAAGAGRVYQHTLNFCGDARDNRAAEKRFAGDAGQVGSAGQGGGTRQGGSAADTGLPWLPAIAHDAELPELIATLSAVRQTRDNARGRVSSEGVRAAMRDAGTRDNARRRVSFEVGGERAAVVNNLGELHLASRLNTPFETGPSLGCYNQATLELFAHHGARRVWLGPELSLRDLEQMAPGAPVPLGITVSGAQELMTGEHCALMAEGDCDQRCGSCSRRNAPRLLEDRKGYRFPVRTDNAGRSHLYNALPLDIAAELPRLLACGITAFLVDCTLLDNARIGAEVARVARACSLAIAGSGAVSRRKATTTGHLYRGVL
jgi:putative protease